MILLVLYGPPHARRGCAPDQALEGDPEARGADQAALRAWRPKHTGQRAQLRERVAQIEEIRGLSAQQDAKVKEIEYIGEELVGVIDLYKKNLIPIVRLMQLQRTRRD